MTNEKKKRIRINKIHTLYLDRRTTRRKETRQTSRFMKVKQQRRQKQARPGMKSAASLMPKMTGCWRHLAGEEI